jgi:hypothetical protein
MQTVVDDLLNLADVGDAGLHLECCVEPKFYCGVPYHPEVKADADLGEDECCKSCIDLLHKGLCPPGRPTHMHCPLNRRRVCQR